ncbi:TMV resistance protein N-like [Dorcoceras hygrometricum]|nr:TMV resistance protein N-like [Dorcoceras hygrometricum]
MVSHRLNKTTSHSLRHCICHQLVTQNQRLDSSLNATYLCSCKSVELHKCNDWSPSTNQNDVAFTNPKDSVLCSLQKLDANRYLPVNTSHNVAVLKFLSAFCGNPHKRCCWQTLPTTGYSTPNDGVLTSRDTNTHCDWSHRVALVSCENMQLGSDVCEDGSAGATEPAGGGQIRPAAVIFAKGAAGPAGTLNDQAGPAAAGLAMETSKVESVFRFRRGQIRPAAVIFAKGAAGPAGTLNDQAGPADEERPAGARRRQSAVEKMNQPLRRQISWNVRRIVASTDEQLR